MTTKEMLRLAGLAVITAAAFHGDHDVLGTIAGIILVAFIVAAGE